MDIAIGDGGFTLFRVRLIDIRTNFRTIKRPVVDTSLSNSIKDPRMAKKTSKKAATATTESTTIARGSKSDAIRDYMAAHKGAMPKEIVAALKEQGVVVSPNLVSILRAKQKIKSARKNIKSETVADNGASSGNNAAALEAALTLYKAARSSPTGNSTKTRQAFLLLVETFG